MPALSHVSLPHPFRFKDDIQANGGNEKGK